MQCGIDYALFNDSAYCVSSPLPCFSFVNFYMHKAPLLSNFILQNIETGLKIIKNARFCNVEFENWRKTINFANELNDRDGSVF